VHSTPEIASKYGKLGCTHDKQKCLQNFLVFLLIAFPLACVAVIWVAPNRQPGNSRPGQIFGRLNGLEKTKRPTFGQELIQQGSFFKAQEQSLLPS
jgi:hypothetical protein